MNNFPGNSLKIPKINTLLITLTQEVHNDFHTWNGGFKKPCTVDNLIQFVSELYPDNYEVMLRFNKVKEMLNAQLPS